MFIQKTLAAGVVALTALATTAPAQADSFSFGIHGPNGGVTFHSGDHYRPAGHWNDWRRYDRRWDDRRWDDRGWGDRRWDHAHYRMTPRQVRRSLRHRGFREIRFTDRHGRIYRARATNPRGRRVALTIRSRDARIIEVRRIRRHY
ncbi:MAG TPA: hypothetical protein VLA28_07575 [Afifellaceae bacterium]|nr:hypothetical protein [Afifellaceae bacterium]